MNPNLFEPIPATRLRRDLRKVLRRIERGEGPFRITQRNGPDLVLLPIPQFEQLLLSIGNSPEQADVRDV